MLWIYRLPLSYEFTLLPAGCYEKVVAILHMIRVGLTLEKMNDKHGAVLGQNEAPFGVLFTNLSPSL